MGVCKGKKTEEQAGEPGCVLHRVTEEVSEISLQEATGPGHLQTGRGSVRGQEIFHLKVRVHTWMRVTSLQGPGWEESRS